MYKLSLLILFLTVLTTAGWGQYGALAINTNQGSQWGTASNYSTQWAADQRALTECGSGCHIVQRIQNQCAAYAADQRSGSTVAGWATENNQIAAQNRAVWECRNRGGGACQVRVWACSHSAPSRPGQPQRIDPD
jgi:Domain of unknown function (DUF4189)